MKLNQSGAALIFILLLGTVQSGISQPRIGFFPPQVHQQICRQSTFTRYLEVFNTGKDNLLWNAIFTPGPYDWVTASPVEGVIEPGDTVQIGFYFNSEGLPIDNYYAYLQINSNDPDFPDTTVLAMLHVQDLTIILEPESDSICSGCSTRITQHVFGCSEVYSFIWTSDPPGFYSSEKSPEVSPVINTTYKVTVTDGGYSSQDSVLIRVYGNSGTSEYPGMTQFLVYPNPAGDCINLKFNSERNGKGNLVLNDLSGKLVHSENISFQKGINELFFYASDLAPGMYILIVESGADSYTFPVVKTF